MLKNSNMKPTPPTSNLSSINQIVPHKSPTQSNTQIVLIRLCNKIASLNNLNDKSKEDFIDSSYGYIVKAVCSDSYSPAYESMEIAQKIKRQRKYQRQRSFNFLLKLNFSISN